jgi:hypothetical protein
MREFPKGMKTEYKDFSFEANAVSNSLDVGAIRDIVELGITGKNGEE